MYIEAHLTEICRCPDCNKSFGQKRNLKRHSSAHVRYKCHEAECSKLEPFIGKPAFNDHIAQFHTGFLIDFFAESHLCDNIYLLQNLFAVTVMKNSKLSSLLPITWGFIWKLCSQVDHSPAPLVQSKNCNKIVSSYLNGLF
jgi:Zinc finger, C2H2 type